jgi:hypothetical protein
VMFLVSSRLCIYFSWNFSFEIPHMYDVQAILKGRLFYS